MAEMAKYQISIRVDISIISELNQIIESLLLSIYGQEPDSIILK